LVKQDWCFIGESHSTNYALRITHYHPRSPYATAKAAAHYAVANYREAYGVFASTGILFNHESPLRPVRFVTRKIVSTAARIARGAEEKLKLGNMRISREWGWAPDYVVAMRKILQQESPDDFVIGTGEAHSLQEFTELVFSLVDLDWREHVETSDQLLRPSDIDMNCADPSKASAVLDWRAESKFPEVVRKLVEAEMGGGL
jgi:GDPmannose 4,6-dehydratase